MIRLALSRVHVHAYEIPILNGNRLIEVVGSGLVSVGVARVTGKPRPSALFVISQVVDEFIFNKTFIAQS